MAPPVLCLLLLSVLAVCNVDQGASAGLEVRSFQIGRKLFDESAPAPADDTKVAVNQPTELSPEDAPADSPADPPATAPAPVTKASAASTKASPAPKTAAKKATVPAAQKPSTTPPPTPWYLGGSSHVDSSFAGFIYSFPSDMLNFTAADAFCRTNYKGGHLVSIHSQAQHDFLNKKYVQGTAVQFLPVQVPQQYPAKDGVGHRGVWIGLRTKDENGMTQGWTDGSAYDFDAFLAGKPDNWNGIEGCVQIYGDTTPVGWSGFWDDIACETKMRFICARPVVDAGSNAYPVYNGSEYIFHSEIATWDTAESTCWKLDNGHLVSIHTKAQANWIWQTFVFPKKTLDFAVQLPIVYQQNPVGMTTGHRGIWIGLNLQRGLPGYWTDFSSNDYSSWATSEPNNWNNIEFCTSLYVDSAPKGYAGNWDDLACEAQLPFLCSRAVSKSDQVYPQYNGWEYIMMNDALTWIDANATCVEKYDAHMVSFESQEELSFVYKQYFQIPSNNYPIFLPDMYTDPSNLAAINQSYVGIGRRGVWTGLIMRDSVWQWSDGSTTAFKAWIPGKPDNFLSSETCTQLYIDSKPTGWASYWDDLSCMAKCSAICKRKPRKKAVQAPSTTTLNPYASDLIPFLNQTDIGVEPTLSDSGLPNITALGKKSTAMSQSSVIALAAVGSFIGLLVLSSVLWRFLRPNSEDEEVVVTTTPGAGTPAQGIPNHYKGKAKATGVVHAPTGAGRVPPTKQVAAREVRPSKYVKINVEDLEVPPENFSFPPPHGVHLDQPRHEVMHKH